MNPQTPLPPRARRWRLRATVLVASAASLLTLAASQAKVETWREDGATAFAKDHREGVVRSDQGRVRLGRKLEPLGPLAADRVWDLARGPDDALYAATGDAGKIFRRAAKEDASWEVVCDLEDTQALSLAILADGTVFAGTGPNGQVVVVSDPKHPSSRPDPAVQYIWDLAADKKGNLFAATGPTGQLWKRSGDGKWTLVLDSKASHLLCLAVAEDGSVYAGSDGNGLVYRIDPEGKASVVFDAPQSEVRTLLAAPDGSIYMGTAADASGGGGSSRPSSLSWRSSIEAGHALSTATTQGTAATGAGRRIRRLGLAPIGERPTIVLTQSQAQAKPKAEPPKAAAGGNPRGGTAVPKSAAPGDNAVFRLDADGVAREVFRAKALIYGLAWVGDRLLIGTGPEGQIFEVRDSGRESVPLAKLDSGQILCLLDDGQGGLLLGTGDPGSVVRLAAAHNSEGVLVSEVHDTKLFSRFGALQWRAEVPDGTRLSVQVRSGNVGEPDETWSEWSAEQTDALSSKAEAPPGRYVQYRVKFATQDPSRSPELQSVSLSFRTTNLPPEINRLDVPDVSTADGTAKQGRLTLKWDVTDPNDDDLSYTLQFRKEGWPAWIPLGDDPITEKTYNWDTSAVPSGLYRVRLSATDRPSNSPNDALTRDRESTPFLIDHEAPHIAIQPHDRETEIELIDDRTRLVKADYALDGGPWVPIFPVDGLFDTSREVIKLSLPDLKPGTHLLMVRATDAAGNVGSGDALLDVKTRLVDQPEASR